MDNRNSNYALVTVSDEIVRTDIKFHNSSESETEQRKETNPNSTLPTILEDGKIEMHVPYIRKSIWLLYVQLQNEFACHEGNIILEGKNYVKLRDLIQLKELKYGWLILLILEDGTRIMMYAEDKQHSDIEFDKNKYDIYITPYHNNAKYKSRPRTEFRVLLVEKNDPAYGHTIGAFLDLIKLTKVYIDRPPSFYRRKKKGDK